MESYLMAISGKLTMAKGQAAVEYLTTYGWAILALVIILAVLLSSGLLSPNAALSEECSFGSNLPCSFALYDDSGTSKILLRLFNGFSYKVKVLSIDLKGEDGTAFAWTGSDVPPFEVESGGNVTLAGTFGQNLPIGSVKRFTGNLTYVSCASEISTTDCSTSQHSITGRVTGKVLPG
jgi:hypothetical protein